MTLTPLTALGAGLVLTLVPGRARAADLVVDPLGGGDHLTIQAAVDAAGADDLILVRAGAYAGNVVVDGKPLWIAAFDGEQVTIAGSLEVRNLAADGVFVAIGLDAMPPDSTNSGAPAAAGLRLAANQGEVRIHDGTFVGARGLCEEWEGCFTTSSAGGHGAWISGCARVALAASTFRGGVGGGADTFGVGPSGDGVRETTSAVAAWSCVFEGGNGLTQYGPGGDGGAGFRATSFGVFASACTFKGGNGGHDNDFIAPSGGNGGHGLVIGGTSQARATEDCTMQGGARGQALCLICGGVDGQPGDPVSGPGPQIAIGGKGRTLRGPAVVSAGSSPTFTIGGEPGDTHYVRYSGASRYVFQPWRRGFDLVDTPFVNAQPVGVVPGAGVLSAAWTVPGLRGGPSLRLFGQAFVVTAAGSVVLGAPHDLVLLGP